MPDGRNLKYGGWHLPHGIIYPFFVAVKVYVDEIDGTSALVAETCHTVGNISTVVGTRHTG